MSEKPPVFEWVEVQTCTKHQDCIDDPIVGIRCFADKARPDIRPINLFEKLEGWSRLPFDVHPFPIERISREAGRFYLTFYAQTSLLPRRLRVASSCAGDFEILDFQISNYRYVFGPISALAFAEHAWPRNERYQQMQPGMCAMIVVQNVSNEPKNFSAWLECQPIG